MPFLAHFEIDIISALVDQLVPALDRLNEGPLTDQNIEQVPEERGVYQLFHRHILVYVGKADKLRERLQDHRRKILGRKNIDIADMSFKCLTIHRNWTALAPEETLIRHYQKQRLSAWNGASFGPHDPGRNREATNKPPQGFDAQYPIKENWRCTGIAAGQYKAAQLLKAVKDELPFTFRYQEAKKGGHPDYNTSIVTVPQAGMGAEELICLIAQSLPQGWQATRFPSHMILYKESRPYTHGTLIWPIR